MFLLLLELRTNVMLIRRPLANELSLAPFFPHPDEEITSTGENPKITTHTTSKVGKMIGFFSEASEQ